MIGVVVTFDQLLLADGELLYCNAKFVSTAGQEICTNVGEYSCPGPKLAADWD